MKALVVLRVVSSIDRPSTLWRGDSALKFYPKKTAPKTVNTRQSYQFHTSFSRYFEHLRCPTTRKPKTQQQLWLALTVLLSSGASQRAGLSTASRIGGKT